MYLQPMTAVVTNIDADHMETYDGDFEKLHQTFAEFLHHLPFYGLAILCIDDVEVARLLPKITRPVVTYGFSDEADVQAHTISQQTNRTMFKVSYADSASAKKKTLDITLNMPGEHNVLNALAAIAVAHEVGVNDKDIQKALKNFQGIGRRFQIYGEYETSNGRVLHVDDYGHHPREVAATIHAVRKGWPDNRLVVVFQPHRYTRTRDLFEDFSMVLSEVDVLVLLEVYAAGELPIAGADGRALARAIRMRGQVDPVFVEDINDVPQALSGVLKDGDILLTLGAGNIGAAAAGLKEALAK